MSECKSEVLPSGRIFNDYGEGCFSVSGRDKTISVGLKREDINRMHGIAFPEKRRTGECHNTLASTEVSDIVVVDLTQTDVSDINVGDMKQAVPGDKYEQRVRAVAEEMAITKHPVSYKLYTKYSTIDTASWSADFYKQNWPIIVDGFMDYARIAVAAQAEAIKKALNEFYGLEAHCDIGDDPESQVTEEQCARIKAHDIEVYLIEHGYVPGPEWNKCSICGGKYKIINCVSFCIGCGRERD
jgi:hypothetical protein